MTGLAVRTNEELAELGRNLVASGCFPDTGTAAQAVVKILAGAEIGLPPIDAMRSFHVMQDGRITPSAALYARAVKGHPRYDYSVAEFTDEACELVFYDTGEEAGRSRFTLDDARQAGSIRPGGAWMKQPRNMLFNRAITNGVAWFAPDVLAPTPDAAAPATGAAPDALDPDADPGVLSAPRGLGTVISTDAEIVEGEPSDPDEALAYGEGASGSEGSAIVEEAGPSPDGGEQTSDGPVQANGSASPAHVGPHVWREGAHGFAYCGLDGCLASERWLKVVEGL